MEREPRGCEGTVREIERKAERGDSEGEWGKVGQKQWGLISAISSQLRLREGQKRGERSGGERIGPSGWKGQGNIQRASIGKRRVCVCVCESVCTRVKEIMCECVRVCEGEKGREREGGGG